jgi:hypothetical protein
MLVNVEAKGDCTTAAAAPERFNAAASVPESSLVQATAKSHRLSQSLNSESPDGIPPKSAMHPVD